MPALTSIYKQFTQRKSSALIQFIKYGMAGAIATGVHALSFYLLAWLVFPSLEESDVMARLVNISVPEISDSMRARNAIINNGIAFIFSNLAAYLINIQWVFEPGRHHRVIEIGMFYLVSGASLLIGNVLMWTMIRFYSVSTTTAFVAVVITSVMINYVMRKYCIFKG